MRNLRTSTAVALCVVAVLAAHEFAYRVAIPDATERAHLLHESGHGWFALAPIAVAVALGVLAFAVATAERPGRLRFALAPIAAGSYIALEFVERLAHGAHHGLVHIPTLVVGATFAALLGAAASLLVHRAHEALCSLRYRPVALRLPRPLPVSLPAAQVAGLCAVHVLAVAPVRGPPR